MFAWLYEKLLKSVDILPFKKRLIAGGTALVIGWIQWGLAHLPGGIQIPPVPMEALQVTLEWGFDAASALFIYGAILAIARGKAGAVK